MASKIKAPNSLQDVPLSVVKNMITLATSGFGLVVALAWNEFIKSAITNLIDPLLGKNSGLISLFIYAFVMTLAAVFVTMQLAQLEKKLEGINNLVAKKKNKKL